MKIIDFRCRPNVVEYMQMYDGPAAKPEWDLFGYPCPPSVSKEEFLEALDRNHIYKAVFVGRMKMMDGQFIGTSNEFVSEFVKTSGGRMEGIASVDPNHMEDPVAELVHAMTDLGLKGVLLDPQNYKIPIDDERLMPIYEKANQLSVPVVITMGPLTGKYHNPLAVDHVAELFPDLTIVCSHGIYPNPTECIALAYRRPNVYLECSIYEFLPGGEVIVDAANTILKDKMVYASAFPFNPIEIVEAVKKLPFSEDTLERMFYHTPAKILKIE